MEEESITCMSHSSAGSDTEPDENALKNKILGDTPIDDDANKYIKKPKKRGKWRNFPKGMPLMEEQNNELEPFAATKQW